MSDYIHIEKEYFKIKNLRPVKEGESKIKLGTNEVILLSKIISFADVDADRKNSNHACRCSNAYLVDLIQEQERTVQRALRALKVHNLIYIYEYKADKYRTRDRYIFPNWNRINDVCGTDLTEYEIPEYVISNTEKLRGDKFDVDIPTPTTNLAGEGDKFDARGDKSDTLIIDNNIYSNRYNILDFPLSSDDETGNEDNMNYSIMEMLYAYLKYEKEVVDIATNMEKNIDTLSESEIKELLSDSGFDIHMYADFRKDIKEGCKATLAYIKEDKEYEKEEKRRQEEYDKQVDDQEEAWIEQQAALLNDPYFESEEIA